MMLLVVGGVVAIALARRQPVEQAKPPRGTETVEVTSQRHVQGQVAYDRVPPAGGDMSDATQDCGAYTTPVPTEGVMHSLEHGAVWITYSPELPEGEAERLRGMTRSRSKLLVSPWPGDNLPAKIVATAWARQLKVGSASDPRIEQFVKAFISGAQAPEGSGPCSMG